MKTVAIVKKNNYLYNSKQSQDKNLKIKISIEIYFKPFASKSQDNQKKFSNKQ